LNKVAVTDVTVAAIEQVLKGAWPGGWRAKRERDVVPGTTPHDRCWRLDVPEADHRHPSVDHVWLCVDGDFPVSRMRVIAPDTQATAVPVWPHVEDHGALCLGALPANDIALHVRFAVDDAVGILSLDAPARAAELSREFVSYWTRQVEDAPIARAIVVPGGMSRTLVWSELGPSPVFAEDEAAMKTWFANLGAKPAPIRQTRLVVLPAPLLPDAFPKTGADVFALAPGMLEQYCRYPHPLPVLIEAATPSGSAMVALQVSPVIDAGYSAKRAHKRTRAGRIKAYAKGKAELLRLRRQDAAWVHGRAANPQAAALSAVAVGVVGCGALGSEVARLVASAGVGEFVLVDPDLLEAPNTSRHLLGAREVGHAKAATLADRLARDFPHQSRASAYNQKFEDLTDDELETLSTCKVVIAAGLGAVTLLRIARWLATLDDPPVVVATWTEEFACVGHAMTLAPGLDAAAFLDDTGRPLSNLTSHWPRGTGTVQEAGCGSSFQPYNATDMLGTIGTCSRLVLELLLGAASAPLHRLWLGDRRIPVGYGATCSPRFDGSFCEVDGP
jgi:ThiF family